MIRRCQASGCPFCHLNSAFLTMSISRIVGISRRQLNDYTNLIWLSALTTTVNATAIRIATADFVDAINQSKCFLQSAPLDGSWLIPTFAHKKTPAPWVTLVLDMRLNPQHEIDRISCITQVPLQVWIELTAEEIRSKIPGAPGASGRFRAALHRF